MMAEQAPVTVDADTIQRLAREVVKIELTPAEVDGLKLLVNALNSEIDKVSLEDRRGAVPETLFRLEEWN